MLGIIRKRLKIKLVMLKFRYTNPQSVSICVCIWKGNNLIGKKYRKGQAIDGLPYDKTLPETLQVREKDAETGGI